MQGKVGGGQRCLLCLRCLACACWRLRGVWGSVLARESAALLGHLQQRVGVGLLLRQAASALGCAVC
jgi:hypothetical protein